MNSLDKILKLYDLKSQEIEKLDGYASINYSVKSEGTNYLLKHYLDANEYKLIYEEEKILQFLSKRKLPFQIPSCLQEMQRHNDNSFSRLLPFIEGKLLSSVNHSDGLLENFGTSIGILNTHLLGIKNDTIKARELFWDMKHTLLNAEKKSFIKNPEDRKVVSYYLDLFEHHVVPIQNTLRHSIIHSDLNDNNVLVENENVTGLIDFGDITIALSYMK